MKNNNSIDLKYHDLMLHRINEILLVSSPYDSFILEEDGNFSDQILLNEMAEILFDKESLKGKELKELLNRTLPFESLQSQ